ncbi:lectin C-type domain protein [Oesophagostomum dentatum]|uniref:Lectin C-type domain protein n=1 Tax=Oesophagostomum dentatum TaxID=61180 RepID=A0A0B1SYT7_OESDE|nr:lectin C-type domain protein [Oesophagostomum dentatum]
MQLAGAHFGGWVFYESQAVSMPFACQVPDCSSSVSQEPVQLLERIGYFDNDTSDYYLFGSVTHKLDSYDAEVQCQRLGGHLPSISNAYENTQVLSAAKKVFSQGSGNTLILGYQTSGKGFSWTDGNPSKYTNWAPGQPERDVLQPQAWMNFQTGFWYASSPDSTSYFMCALPAHRQSCNNLP